MTITSETITKLNIQSGDILIFHGQPDREEVGMLYDLLNSAGIDGVKGIHFADGASLTVVKDLNGFDGKVYNGLLPHQQRVVVEKLELDDKLHKLRGFLGTELFAGLSLTDRHLLEVQEATMAHYSHILGQRIAAFGNSTEAGPVCDHGWVRSDYLNADVCVKCDAKRGGK